MIDSIQLLIAMEVFMSKSIHFINFRNQMRKKKYFAYSQSCITYIQWHLDWSNIFPPISVAVTCISRTPSHSLNIINGNIQLHSPLIFEFENKFMDWDVERGDRQMEMRIKSMDPMKCLENSISNKDKNGILTISLCFSFTCINLLWVFDHLILGIYLDRRKQNITRTMQ